MTKELIAELQGIVTKYQVYDGGGRTLETWSP